MLTPVTRYIPIEEGLLAETRLALCDLRLDPQEPDGDLLPGQGHAGRKMREENGWSGAEVRQVRQALARASEQLRSQTGGLPLDGTRTTLLRDAEKLDRLWGRWFPTLEGDEAPMRRT